MKIQVYGSGCPTCHKLFEFTKKAVEELNLKIDVEYICDIQKIIELGIMQSPVLLIDDKPVLVGNIGNPKMIKELIQKEIK
jgi:small redox-active disulfide protein 2